MFDKEILQKAEDFKEMFRVIIGGELPPRRSFLIWSRSFDYDTFMYAADITRKKMGWEQAAGKPFELEAICRYLSAVAKYRRLETLADEQEQDTAEAKASEAVLP